jgi:thymidylate synthase
MSRALAFVESLQVLSGYFDERLISKAAPGLVYSYGYQHAYGTKIFQQLPKVIDQLKSNPESRRAVIHIGKPEDGQETEKPCIQTIQFLIRDNQLHTMIFARSWDAVMGLPYDVSVANFLAEVVRSILSYGKDNPLGSGNVYGMASSLHIYNRDIQKVTDVSANPPSNLSYSLPQYEDLSSYRNMAIDQLELFRKGDWKVLPKLFTSLE